MTPGKPKNNKMHLGSPTSHLRLFGKSVSAIFYVRHAFLPYFFFFFFRKFCKSNRLRYVFFCLFRIKREQKPETNFPTLHFQIFISSRTWARIKLCHFVMRSKKAWKKNGGGVGRGSGGKGFKNALMQCRDADKTVECF